MRVITPGHKYELQNFEGGIKPTQELSFIHKEPIGPGSTTLETVENGTTNEEVIEAVIDRVKFLQAKFPCKENACCITHMEEALMWLEKRTRDREKRNVEGKNIA